MPSVEPEHEPERCCFDDWVENWDRKARKKDTVAGVTTALLAALVEAGLAERTVLDVGCGIGDLALATLARGATRADGFDLSEKAIEQARKLAQERGLTERAGVAAGDGATVDLPAADAVAPTPAGCGYPAPG